MRENGVEVNEKAKYHNGLQNITEKGQEIPLILFRGLFHVPIREPTNEYLQRGPILESDDPWDPKHMMTRVLVPTISGGFKDCH